jgi:hypothetical protein
VSGIVKNITEVTDFVFEEFISSATIVNTGLKNRWNWKEWGSINSSSQMFVKLKDGTEPTQIEKQLAGMRNKYREKSKDGDDKDDTQHFLQALSDIHFNADYDTFEQRQAHKPTLYGLLAVAFLFVIRLYQLYKSYHGTGCTKSQGNWYTENDGQREREIDIPVFKRDIPPHCFGNLIIGCYYPVVIESIRRFYTTRNIICIA